MGFEHIYSVHYSPSGVSKIDSSVHAAIVPDDGEFQALGVDRKAAEEYVLKWFKDRFALEFEATDIVLVRL